MLLRTCQPFDFFHFHLQKSLLGKCCDTRVNVFRGNFLQVLTWPWSALTWRRLVFFRPFVVKCLSCITHTRLLTFVNATTTKMESEMLQSKLVSVFFSRPVLTLPVAVHWPPVRSTNKPPVLVIFQAKHLQLLTSLEASRTFPEVRGSPCQTPHFDARSHKRLFGVKPVLLHHDEKRFVYAAAENTNTARDEKRGRRKRELKTPRRMSTMFYHLFTIKNRINKYNFILLDFLLTQHQQTVEKLWVWMLPLS